MAQATGLSAQALSDPGQMEEAIDDPKKRYNPSNKLPKIHWCAYKGDLSGVLMCITDGHSIQDSIALRNQHGRLVCGITPLFLAAQRGHYEVAKLLVENGANPVQPCFIQGSNELCTPGEVANINLHFKVARYLKTATKAKRKEEQVLALDDEERASRVSSKLVRGLERARSMRSYTGSAAGRSAIMGTGGAGADGFSQLAAEPEAQMAAAAFVQNVDLMAFDPEAGEQPPAARGGAVGPVKQLLGRFFSRRSGMQPSTSTRVGGAASASGAAADDATAAQRAVRKMDLESYDPDRPDHQKVLSRFLKDLDLANWEPETDGPLQEGAMAASPAGPATSRGTSPARMRHASPSRSSGTPAAGGRLSPARSRT